MRTSILPVLAAGATSLLLLSSAGCAGARPRPSPVQPEARGPRIVVVAPHPDDEVLIAAHALAGREPLQVIVLTNGDYRCRSSGLRREGETVEALALLGRQEDDVHFLGYPDGHLVHLGDRTLADVDRIDASGRCVGGHETYGNRGFRRRDAHAARTGQPAPYAATALVDDLTRELAAASPTMLYVTHGVDDHPDHAMTYAFTRQALERAHLTPVLRRAIVHAGPCWPNGSDKDEPCASPHFQVAPMPPLPEPLAAYRPTLRVPLDDVLADKEPTRNRKALAITRYASQTGPSPLTDWLITFARTEEIFWEEQLTWNGERLERTLARGIVEGHGCDDYELAQRAGRLVLVRRGAVLRALALPDDEASAAHAYELLVDPRPDDGSVVELTVRRDGAVRLVTVDAASDGRCLRERGRRRFSGLREVP